ncbi:MAG: tRNA (5-methylaminomethyl-2-thiouridine)(34)-methyltransferase MnmD, partial [Bdellovibrionales bacterium]
MNGAPQKTLRSEQFDDVYFSAENGLAEARHVFLAGNGLPAAWAGRDVFTIAETGFGTGLNFLAVWQLFAETAKAGQRLEFISVEKYPLTRDEIAAALEPFAKDFAALMPVYLAQYPHVQTDRVSLRMIEGDVNDVLP